MDNKKKYYIICRPAHLTGIGEVACGIAAHTIFARDNGMIPIVDMQHYRNQYFKDGMEYKENSWEYFFEQPAGVSINEIDDGECKISGIGIYPENKNRIAVWDLPTKGFYSVDPEIKRLREQYREIIHLNKETLEYVQNKYNEIIKEDKNILGVLVRGTDYAVRKTKGEQRQPKPKAVIKKIYKYLKKYPEISKIYIATEDDKLFNLFKAEFGDKLLDNNQYRFKYDAQNMPIISTIKVDRPNHNWQLAREYLSSLYILSKCKYFIGGRCAGSKVAWIMSDGWEDCYMWSLGRYGHIRLFDYTKNIFQITNKRDENRVKYKEITIFGIKFALRKKNPRNK